MARLTFIIGGIKSGKSNYVLELARKYKNERDKKNNRDNRNKRILYIATADSRDVSLREKIKEHKIERQKTRLKFQLIEETHDILKVIKEYKDNFSIIIIECIGMLVANLMKSGYSDEAIEKNIKRLLNFLKVLSNEVIVVSNEVGMSLVSMNNLGARFQELIGKINQLIALESDNFYLLVAGVPVKIK